jgi:hypothetical protein
MREDRAVVRAGEHHGHPGRPGRVDDESFDVHPAAFKLVAQEATERVVADDAAELGAEPKPSRTGRDDGARTPMVSRAPSTSRSA